MSRKNCKKSKEMQVIEQEENYNDESNSDIELIEIKKHDKTKIKERKPYILTDARKEQFEKARMQRLEKIENNRQVNNAKDQEFNKMKNELIKQKEDKKLKKQQKELNKLTKELKEIDEYEEEHIVKPKKIIKKRVVYESDDEEEEIVYRKKPKQIIQSPVQQPSITRRVQIQYL